MKIIRLGLLLLLGLMPGMTACGLGGGEKADQEESQRDEKRQVKSEEDEREGKGKQRFQDGKKNKERRKDKDDD